MRAHSQDTSYRTPARAWCPSSHNSMNHTAICAICMGQFAFNLVVRLLEQCLHLGRFETNNARVPGSHAHRITRSISTVLNQTHKYRSHQVSNSLTHSLSLSLSLSLLPPLRKPDPWLTNTSEKPRAGLEMHTTVFGITCLRFKTKQLECIYSSEVTVIANTNGFVTLIKSNGSWAFQAMNRSWHKTLQTSQARQLSGQTVESWPNFAMPLELDTSRTCQSWLCCKVQPQSLGLLAFVLANRCTVAGTLYEYLSVSCTVLLLALERTSLELLVGYQLVIAKKCKNVAWAQRTGAAIKQSQKFGRSNFCVFKGSQKTLNFFHARTWGHLSTWACCCCVLPSNCVECGGIAVDIKSGQIQMKQGRAGFWDFNIYNIYIYIH